LTFFLGEFIQDAGGCVGKPEYCELLKLLWFRLVEKTVKSSRMKSEFEYMFPGEHGIFPATIPSLFGVSLT
tara:strand:+ start:8713 stop:8925 length:213 start_codon:yes stop_codon:yes gene_type:complete